MSAWQDAVRGIADTEGDENLSVSVISPLEPAGTRPVLIIVHPGDASAEPGIDGALEAITETVRNAIEQGHSITVLHRFSSVYFDPGSGYTGPESLACDYWFGRVIEGCEEEGTAHYYGDHLDEFCGLIAPALAGRPALVTGLWGDEKDGCVSEVRRGLEARGVQAKQDEGCPKAWEREPGFDL